MQNLSNSFGVYVGRLNEATDFTGTLGSPLVKSVTTLKTIADICDHSALSLRLLGTNALAATSAATATYSAFRRSSKGAQASAVLLVAQAEQQDLGIPC